MAIDKSIKIVDKLHTKIHDHGFSKERIACTGRTSIVGLLSDHLFGTCQSTLNLAHERRCPIFFYATVVLLFSLLR